jgi:uncharacterized damage-inducible protein DinB
MIRKIADFKQLWKTESENTLKMLEVLNDQALKQEIAPGHRSLDRLAWHITQTIPEMGKQIGLEFSTAGENQPVPASLSEIIQAYRTVSSELIKEIEAKWIDDTLQEEDELYGMTWARGITLQILVNHEIHHRGQMTVLIRQAGLKLPGIYGPALEEWEHFGQKPPQV